MNDQQQDQTGTLPAPRWCGWARNGTGGKWRCLVRGAASDTEAMEKLREGASGRGHVDLCCLPEGRSPDDRTSMSARE